MALGALIGLGATALGSVLGGDRTRTSSTSTESGSTRSRQTGGIDDFGFRQGTEDPILGGARNSLLNLLLGQAEDDSPVFGDSEIASFLSNTNELFSGAAKAATSNLAATGSLDSGRAAAVQAELQGNKASQISRFFTDLPFREKQARLARLLPILQTGLNFTGRGPTGEISRSDRDIDINNLSEFNRTSTGSGTSKTGGGLTGLGNLIGLLGGQELRNSGGLLDLLGIGSN